VAQAVARRKPVELQAQQAVPPQVVAAQSSQLAPVKRVSQLERGLSEWESWLALA